MNRNKKVSKKKVAAGVAAVAVAAAIGIGGASAFFTDQAYTDAHATAGDLDMKVENLTDLDGQYGTVDPETGNVAYQLKTEGLQAADYTAPTAKDAGNPSTDLINPGDNGIYSYKITNDAAKSFDTKAITEVTLELKNGGTFEDADVNKTYKIEGLGEPKTALSADKTKMYLVYVSSDDAILSGTVEKDGTSDTATYAYDTIFDRLAKNKTQDMSVNIHTDIYAKQHRNSIDSALTTDNVAVDATGKVTITGTGDWAQLDSFENVVDESHESHSFDTTGLGEGTASNGQPATN